MQMKIIKYLKEKGLKHTISVIWKYKLDLLLIKIILFFTKNKPLKDIIVIGSHNDFDSNGGAFYDYLIENKYNEHYLIIWLLRNPLNRELPKNVKAFYLRRPSILKNYYIARAKFFTADGEVTGKVRNLQKSYYLTHGPFSLKDTSEKLNIPGKVDYLLITSASIGSLQKKVYRPQQTTKLISLGFPLHDKLLNPGESQLKKIVAQNTFNKVIMWMPTFRKGGGAGRNDSNIELPLGVPLIESDEDYNRLDSLLKEQNILLIIKIHPMQDMATLKIKSSENIAVLTGTDVKKLGVDTHDLLKETDALISDYSSVAYDYLMLNRPIGYIFSDLKDYKIGLLTDEPEKFIAGPIINTYEQMQQFILGIACGQDDFYAKRKNLRDKIFEYHDAKSCKRLVEHMGLRIED